MGHDVLAVGRIKAANGLKGKMWVTPLGDTFNPYDRFIIGENASPRKLVSLEKRRNGYVLYLEGITDITQVEKLLGQNIYVSRKDLPATVKDEFYWDDLIGMQVIDINGRSLGEIVTIIPTGSNDVFVVDRDKQLMIPWTSSVVKEISIESNTVVVDTESIKDILGAV